MKPLLLLIVFLATCYMSFGQEKKAFIVGISQYEDANKGWSNISGAQDADHIRSFLINSLDFKENDITVLKDSVAKKANVLNALDSFSNSINDSTSLVFLYFATHGQQVSDHPDPEFADENLDHLDEALIMYDTPMSAKDVTSSENYKGELHLLDDELQPFLYAVRSQMNSEGQVFMGVDACFSATTDKAGADIPVRGTTEKFMFYEGNSTFKSDTLELKEFYSKQKNLASFVLATGSQANMTNMQYNNNIGSLTYGLSAAYKKLNNTSISYENFYKYIKDEFKKVERLNFGQRPTISGNKEQSIFKGNTISYPYFLSNYFHADDTKDNILYKFPYGNLHGYSVGTVFKIVDRRTEDLLGYGQIKEANEVRSVFSCSEKLSHNVLNNAIFIPIKLNYVKANFKVNFDRKSKKKLKHTIKLKSIENMHNKNSKYAVEYKKDSYEITYNGMLILDHVDASNLEYQLVYLSYIEYLKILHKDSGGTKKFKKDFIIITDGDKSFIVNNSPYKFYYNIALLDDKLEVVLPNDIYRNHELFVGKSFNDQKTLKFSNKKNNKIVLALEKVISNYNENGDYFPKLSLDKSIFNYDFFKFKEQIPKDISFKSTELKLSGQPNFYLFMVNE